MFLAPAMIAFYIIAKVIPARIRMQRHARELLRNYPGAPRTSVYLAFSSTWANGKEREMQVKISEMAAEGWTFLRATEANLLRQLGSWGGGLNLHFIRLP